MSQHHTHIVKLREGKAPAIHVTAAELKQMQDTLPRFATSYDVTEIKHADKPAALTPAVLEESKKSDEATPKVSKKTE